MRKFIVTAAALALLALPAAACAGEKLDGVWEGAYTCIQGKTGVTLTLDTTATGKVTGTFAFWPRSDNPNVESGSFAVRGTVTPKGELRLYGDHWINQPDGYAMVGLQGVAHTGLNDEIVAMTGQVMDLDGCTKWAVKRK